MAWSKAAERSRSVRSETFPKSEARSEWCYGWSGRQTGKDEGGCYLTDVDNFLKKLGNEREVRDRAIVFQVIWVKVVLFQGRTNNSCLKSCGKGTCAQGCVDDVSDGRKQAWKAVREERCRNGVKFT